MSLARLSAASRGALLTALSAFSFALSSVFARLAYEAGSNPVTVGATRMLLGAAAVGVALLLARERLTLPGRLAAAPPVLGIVLAGYSWSLLTAVERMPVALAVLAFYVFPILIAVGAAWEGRERVGRGRALAIAAAFAGLALALGGEAGALDPAGLGFALLAAFGNAALFFLTRDVPGPERRRLTAQLLACSGLILLAAGAAAGALRPPGTGAGFGALAAASACYAVAMTSMFAALALLGPVQVGALFNVEPVASLALGLAVLGERPGPAQVVGMAVVVAALVAVQKGGQPRE